MRLKTVLVALVVVLAAGPALAIGGVAGQQTVTDGTANAVADEHVDCEFPIEVEDATGETVTIEEEPEEVVVLAPNVAQHLWEIGAEEKVTGMPVGQYTSYLNGSEQRTNVVDESIQPVNEEVIALEPDLVLAPNITSKDSISQLRDSGETVYHYEVANDLDKMLQLVDRTGQLVGECEAATEETDELSERIDTVEQAVADEEQPTVFYDLGSQYSVNNQSLEHDVVTTAGGENIAAEIQAEFGGGYPQVSAETIVAENPDFVIKTDGLRSEFSGYEELSAVANDSVVDLEGNFISQHGPRNVDVLEQLAEEFHPEAMEEARQTENGSDDMDGNTTDDEMDGNTTDDEMDGNMTDDEMDGNTTDDEMDGSEESGADDSGAGLTVGAAVAAVIALAVAASRRE